MSLLSNFWRTLCVALLIIMFLVSAFVWIQAAEIAKHKTNLRTVSVALEQSREATGLSELSRQTERAQASQDFAGEVERNKAEIERVRKSSLAVASLTNNCAFDKGQPAVNRALKDILGEP